MNEKQAEELKDHPDFQPDLEVMEWLSQLDEPEVPQSLDIRVMESINLRARRKLFWKRTLHFQQLKNWILGLVQNPWSLSFKLAVVVIVLIALGGLLLVNDDLKLRTQLKAFSHQPTPQLQQISNLEQQLAGERARADKLAEQLQSEQSRRAQIESELPIKKQLSPVIVSFILTPTISVKSGGTSKKLVVPPDSDFVQLQLEKKVEGEYRFFRVQLLTVNDEEVWSQDLPEDRMASRNVLLKLPAKILKEDYYKLELSGITASGDIEDVASYSFAVLRKR